MFNFTNLKFYFFIFFSLLIVQIFADYPRQLKSIKNKEYDLLDDLALKAGTDKSSSHHNYTRIYADYFAPLRNKRIKFLEIGIYLGNSVKLWEDYFPKAELHFIDSSFDHIKYWSKRAKYHQVDQANRSELENFIESVGGNFDVIVDDGGHTMEQQITSFEALFPYVRSGGWYIIEDIHTSYWIEFGGNGTRESPKSGSGTCVDYLKGLIDDLNYTGARTMKADHEKASQDLRQSLNYYQEHIYTMHFYDSLCCIKKR